MKNFINLKNYLLALSLLFLMTGCSPFGANSFINQIASNIVDSVSSKTATEVVAGGAQTLTTTPAVSGSPTYTVTVSVGNQYADPVQTTSGGYKVYTSVQGFTSSQ